MRPQTSVTARNSNSLSEEFAKNSLRLLLTRRLENVQRLHLRNDTLKQGNFSTPRNLGAQRNGCASERVSGVGNALNLATTNPSIVCLLFGLNAQHVPLSTTAAFKFGYFHGRV